MCSAFDSQLFIWYGNNINLKLAKINQISDVKYAASNSFKRK